MRSCPANVLAASLALLARAASPAEEVALITLDHKNESVRTPPSAINNPIRVETGQQPC
jgi:hypothetical protein